MFVLVNCWVATAYIANIALEVLYIDDVKPDYGLYMSGFNRMAKIVNTNRVESHICLRYPIAVVIRASGRREVFLYAIERLEQLRYRLLVRFLCTA
jgi:hypothetical protein